MRFRDLKKKQHKKASEEKNIIHYARYTDRIKALITDMFMIYAPILYIITYGFMGGKDDFQSSQIAPLVGVTMYGVIYAILLAKKAQTPGKKAYTIKVVDANTMQNISFIRAFVRFVAFLFTATTLLGLLLPLYRKDKKALHDLIASTIVLQTDNHNL